MSRRAGWYPYRTHVRTLYEGLFIGAVCGSSVTMLVLIWLGELR